MVELVTLWYFEAILSMLVKNNLKPNTKVTAERQLTFNHDQHTDEKQPVTTEIESSYIPELNTVRNNYVAIHMK